MLGNKHHATEHYILQKRISQLPYSENFKTDNRLYNMNAYILDRERMNKQNGFKLVFCFSILPASYTNNYRGADKSLV
jgi:hypothetical protein